MEVREGRGGGAEKLSLSQAKQRERVWWRGGDGKTHISSINLLRQ